jgi:hypothetical protein
MKFLFQRALPILAASSLLFLGWSGFQSATLAQMSMDGAISKGEQPSLDMLYASTEQFYGVVRESDGRYYQGNGGFTPTVREAARFFTLQDAINAANSLNQQGYCSASCRAKTVWVDW